MGHFMKVTAKAATALTAGLVVMIAGASSITARVAPFEQASLAAPKNSLTVTVPPGAARSAIGIAPTMNSPLPAGPRAVLGTVLTFRLARNRVNVQATAVHTTDTGSPTDTRLMNAAVSYAATAGTVGYAPTDFTMINQTGERYAPQPNAVSSEPLLGSGELSPGGTAEGVVVFQVPANAAGLVLAYAPAPSHTTLGTWALSAP